MSGQFGSPQSMDGGRRRFPLSIWTSEKEGDRVAVTYVPKPESDPSIIDKIYVRIIEYTPDVLPARVLSWLPYRVTVDSPAGGWLETPRSYQRYWISSVESSGLKKSPEGLVMLKHPGNQEIRELLYDAPRGYYIMFWISLLTSMAVLCARLKRPVGNLL